MATTEPIAGRPDVIALLLAGGRGSRLAPLTDARSKPAMPFGGTYRLIDFALTNLAHSGIRDVWVVEQFKPFELNQHLAAGRPWDLDGTRHGLRILPPFEGGAKDGFAEGNAHAIFQQIPKIKESKADVVVVLSADHVYCLDLRPVVEAHRAGQAELTIVTTEIDGDASRYGVVRSTGDGKVIGFDYKPDDPASQVVATEVFVYDAAALVRELEALAAEMADGGKDDDANGDDANGDDANGAALGDYGESLVPRLVERGTVREHRMHGYWRDLGTIDAFYGAHMDLLDGRGIDLGDSDWPILTNARPLPPAFVGPSGVVDGSLICPGARILGRVEHSVIGPGVVVERGATVSHSVLLGDNTVHSGAVLHSVIGDTGAVFTSGAFGTAAAGTDDIRVVQPEDPGLG